MSIDVSVGEGIELITINRPNRLNAMDLVHYQGLRMEYIANRMLWESDDIKEGTAAFAEKRAPRVQGR